MTENESNSSDEKKKNEEEYLMEPKVDENEVSSNNNADVQIEVKLLEEDSLDFKKTDPAVPDDYEVEDSSSNILDETEIKVQNLEEIKKSVEPTETEEVKPVKIEINQEEQENDSNDIENELLEFADLDDLEGLSEDDLKDMQEAIAENIDDFGESEELQEKIKEEFKPEISEDLELKMQEELEKKKKAQGIKTITKEKFIEYLSVRRNKIVYHALWYLVFNMEDHQAAKTTLYEGLKEVTSKNPVEPIEEHKFYFGLGFILRLKLIDQKIVEFKKGKLNIVANVDTLKSILNIVGDPISDRPILTSSEKKTMFDDFLKDDFLDI